MEKKIRLIWTILISLVISFSFWFIIVYFLGFVSKSEEKILAKGGVYSAFGFNIMNADFVTVAEYEGREVANFLHDSPLVLTTEEKYEVSKGITLTIQSLGKNTVRVEITFKPLMIMWKGIRNFFSKEDRHGHFQR